MRRTYRSKKDTGGALYHRDVLQNMDEKSSAFDAFYIQNIKQTKRELSCVGPSNAYSIPSNRVRKKKYVKRIVKDVETIKPRESMNTTTYLTPDKSIRVNKILDRFDMLLNSSANGQVACSSPAFQTYVPKKQGKTYTRKKPKAVKKFNYTSDSIESDKENTSNTTDIRKHSLVVEKSNNCPKNVDESIYKIVNNSLINSLKRNTANNSFSASYKRKNRFMKNFHSPILQKSPLCSTPFKEKYRGKSIYNISPISLQSTESQNDGTIAEEINESSNSIVFPCKGKNTKLSKEETLRRVTNAIHSKDSTIENYVEQSMIYKEIDLSVTERVNSNAKESVEKSMIYDDIETIPDECENDNIIAPIQTNNISSELQTEQSLSQITEAEPFLGFSNIKEHDILTNEQRYLLKLIQENDNKNLDVSKERSLVNNNLDNKKNMFKEKSLDGLDDEETNKSKEDSQVNLLQENSNKTRNNVSDYLQVKSPDASLFRSNDFCSRNYDNLSVNSVNFDNESMYDTCNSDQSISEDKINTHEPKVRIEKLTDSVFIKYYEKMLLDNQESSGGSDWCNEGDNDGNPDHGDGNNEDKISNKSDNENADNISSDWENDENPRFQNCSQNTSVISKAESDYENPQNEILITDSSTTEDNIESNEDTSYNEQIQASFVTTRRRKVFTKDSMFILDNSYGSSGTDCNKTVLSYKAKLSCFEKSDSESDVSNRDVNEIDALEGNCIEQPTRRSRKKSSRLSRYSIGSAALNLSSNVTIVEPEEKGDNSNDNINKNMCQTKIVSECATTSVTTRKSSRLYKDSLIPDISLSIDGEVKPSIVLQPGKKWERSLSIYRRITTMADHIDISILEDECQKKGRKYRQSVISTMEMQDSPHNESINSRRSTFISKPSRSTIRFVKDSNSSRISLNTTEVFDDLKGFLNEECDDTVIELSKLSLADSEFEVTVLDKFNESSERIATARDYVLRRCNQTDPILFDECYPETALKNCHKIGEGVYGEVFLWRGRDGRARVMKIVPIAGTVKVNGETQKDFHEVISEIVIAMELSALRAPIAEIDRYFDEGKDVESLDLHSVENATDVFNEVLAVRCVQGPYPSRLLDLWELYDECRGSENDNPASLPRDQQYIVLELANAGQDLESYQFTGAQQAHALFQQIAFGLAVGEESFQFEHRDLHWGNVLIAPTEQKVATFVLNGRTYRVPRGGVAATIIDYSLSRVTLPLAADRAALFNDLATDEQLFEAVGDYQFQVYRLMRDKLGNDWKNFEPYTNILWLHYTVDKMITALRYKRTTTKIHKHYIEKLKGIKDRILAYKSATDYVLTDIEI